MSLSFLSPAAFSLLLALPLLLGTVFALPATSTPGRSGSLSLPGYFFPGAAPSVGQAPAVSALSAPAPDPACYWLPLPPVPVLQYDTAGKIAFVLDTSASMQARDPSEPGPTF